MRRDFDSVPIMQLSITGAILRKVKRAGQGIMRGCWAGHATALLIRKTKLWYPFLCHISPRNLDRKQTTALNGSRVGVSVARQIGAGEPAQRLRRTAKWSRTTTPKGPARLAVDTTGLGCRAKRKLRTQIPVAAHPAIFEAIVRSSSRAITLPRNTAITRW